MYQQLNNPNNPNPQIFHLGSTPVVLHPGQSYQIQKKPINLNKNAFMGLGITQMIIGVICFINNIVLLVTPETLGLFSYGFLGGVLFFISGLLTFLTGNKTATTCMIVSTMVMNIISTVISVPVITLASFEIATLGGHPRPVNPVKSGLGSTIMILASIEVIITLACSALCCKARCCCRNSSSSNVIFVQGYPADVSYWNQPAVTFSTQLHHQQPHQTISEENNGFQMHSPPPTYDSKEK